MEEINMDETQNDIPHPKCGKEKPAGRSIAPARSPASNTYHQAYLGRAARMAVTDRQARKVTAAAAAGSGRRIGVNGERNDVPHQIRSKRSKARRMSVDCPCTCPKRITAGSYIEHRMYKTYHLAR
jgi:hypothetical protein